MVSDLSKARQLCHESVVALIDGDPDAQKALWSLRDEATAGQPSGAAGEGLPGGMPGHGCRGRTGQ